jgi:hypothetical protein
MPCGGPFGSARLINNLSGAACCVRFPFSRHFSFGLVA